MPDALQFHSVFVCPITRETGDAGNPPMLLSCGHVISKAAVVGLLDRRSNGRCVPFRAVLHLCACVCGVHWHCGVSPAACACCCVAASERPCVCLSSCPSCGLLKCACMFVRRVG